MFFFLDVIIVRRRDPITLSEDDWGAQSPPKRKVFRFHKAIGCLGKQVSNDKNLLL